jgi:glycosyltransferase involved in cell wall biosynthesis
MIDVLLIAGGVPKPAVLKASLEKFHEAGATVRLAGLFETADIVDADGLGVAGLHSLPEAAQVPGEERLVKEAPKGSARSRTWEFVQRDGWVRAQAGKADVLVALDKPAVYTVWQLAQRNRRADAVFGIAPALKAVADRCERPEHYARRNVYRSIPSPTAVGRTVKHTANGVYQKATSRRVLRTAIGAKAWRAVVAAPGVPDGTRAALAHQVSRSMSRGGRKDGAAILLNSAAARVADEALRADLLAEVARKDIARGHDDPKARTRAIEALLSLADQRYASHETGEAAQALSSALTLAFHRALHFDDVSSPLSTDPDGYMAPFRASKAFAAVSAPRGRRAAATTGIPADRPLRLLVTTSSTANFLQPILERYGDHPGVEIRFLHTKEDEELRPLARDLRRMMEYRLGGQRDFVNKVEDALRPHLDWADTVFVEWTTNAAVLFTLIDPGTTRIMVRLHSFEAWTYPLHLIDRSRIDDMVFVSDHLRDQTTEILPDLREPGGPRLHVLDNAMDLQRYSRPKVSPDARFTLGLVGASAVAKDPRWALDVVRELRRHDSRYRLVIVGNGLDRKLSAAVRRYDDLLREDLEALTAENAVELLGRTEDVPGALTGIGVILSSSVREGAPCCVAEGTASGALPVVRDWPFFAGKENGARTLYPADWIVTTPREAAQRILEWTGSEERWREATAEAAKLSLSTWDWSVVSAEFDRLLIGE